MCCNTAAPRVWTDEGGPPCYRELHNLIRNGCSAASYAWLLLASVSSFTPAAAEPATAVRTVLSAESTVIREPIRYPAGAPPRSQQLRSRLSQDSRPGGTRIRYRSLAISSRVSLQLITARRGSGSMLKATVWQR